MSCIGTNIYNLNHLSGKVKPTPEEAERRNFQQQQIAQYLFEHQVEITNTEGLQEFLKHPDNKKISSAFNELKKLKRREGNPPQSAKEAIEQDREEIISAINDGPKAGMKAIQECCATFEKADMEEALGEFLFKNKNDIDFDQLGEFLGRKESTKILESFIGEMGFEGKSLTEGMRNCLQTFKLSGEAQVIERLAEAFSKNYVKQNANGQIADKDAAMILTYAVLQLNTDLHNTSVSARMTPEDFVKNLRGSNNDEDFDKSFLVSIYNEIKHNEIKILNFDKNAAEEVLSSSVAAIEMRSKSLNVDPKFETLSSAVKKENKKQILNLIPKEERGNVEKIEFKTLHSSKKNYEAQAEMTMKDGNKIIIKIQKPALDSQHASVTISSKDQTKGLDICAHIGSSFRATSTRFIGGAEVASKLTEKTASVAVEQKQKPKQSFVQKFVSNIGKAFSTIINVEHKKKASTFVAKAEQQSEAERKGGSLNF
jgi:Sec7-like guanine-nucleotide exchange factor